MFRKGGESTCFVHKHIRKIHTRFKDGSELVEEYDNETHQLLSRRRRSSTKVGAASSWEALLGDVAPARPAAAPAAAGGLLLQESNRNPGCVRVDTPGCFTWRISNLPYPPSVYSVTVDPNTTTIVVATSNKKYYKRLALPECLLLGLVLDPSRVSWSHQGDTLTVHYNKPPALLAEELADARDAMALRPQEEPAECRQQ